jgi:hypothetical protein
MKVRAPALLCWRLLPLEMAIAFIIISVTTTWCVGQFSRIFDEAHMTEILMRLSAHRIDVAETLAVNGHLESVHMPSNTAVSAQPPKNTGRYLYRTQGAALVSTGNWSSGPAFELTFQPMINSENSGWLLRWGCSNRQTSSNHSLSLKYDALPASTPQRQAPAIFLCKASTGH